MIIKNDAELWRQRQRAEHANLRSAVRRKDFEAGRYHMRMALFCSSVAKAYEQATKEGRG